MLEFLKLHPEAFGLDISERSVKFAQLRDSDGKQQLVSYGNIPLPQGILEKGEIKDEKKLAEHLRTIPQYTQGKKLSTPYVVASLPEEQTFLEIIQLPRMKRAELEHAIRAEAENYIPYSIDTMYLDFQVISPAQKQEHTDVLLVAIPKETVDSYISVLQDAKLRPLALEVESLSVGRALISNQLPENPVLIVDIGLAGSSFSVFVGKSLRFTSSISIGARQFTQSLMKTLQVAEKEADELKESYGLQNQGARGKEVMDALIPPATDLVEQVKKYIEYYSSRAQHQHPTKKNSEIRRVLLAGGGALLWGLPEFLARELQAEVELGNPWVNMGKGALKEIPPIPFRASLPYTPAIGLALYPFQKEIGI